MFLFCTREWHVALTLRHDDRASVTENGTGLTSKVSGQKREGGKGKSAHHHDLYITQQYEAYGN